MGRAMATQVEELPDNRVRLTVEVPQADLQHAVEHATSDLARSVKVPGFRRGKVPTQVLEARIGRERIFTEAGERDLVVELGSGRLLEELERALTGAEPGETKQVELEQPDGSKATATITLKELKEKVLPPLDDELARSASEFATLAELRADIEQRIRDVLEEEAETQFRAAAVDSLVEATGVQAAGPLVEARTRELLNAFGRSLDRRSIDAEAYLQLSGQTPDQLVERLRAEAQLSVARELVLEAVADKLGLEVPDQEIEELIREQAEAHGDDPDEAVKRVFEDGRHETLRADLRLRTALDRVAAEAKRVPADVARARESIWTPDKETPPIETKLWTPGSKEPA